MAKSDTTGEIHSACAAAGGAGARKTRSLRISDRVGRCAARLFTCVLSIAVALMATAQSVYGQDRISHVYFEFAPNLPDAEAELVADSVYKTLLVPTVTGLLVALGVFLLYWFTVGGGSKSKFTEN